MTTATAIDYYQRGIITLHTFRRLMVRLSERDEKTASMKRSIDRYEVTKLRTQFWCDQEQASLDAHYESFFTEVECKYCDGIGAELCVTASGEDSLKPCDYCEGGTVWTVRY